MVIKWLKVKEGEFNQYIAVLSACLGYAITGSAMAWPSPTLVMMANREAPLVLNTTQISWMVSLLFVGILLSPLPTGYAMERIGRKCTCLLLSIFPFTSWVLIYYATTAVHLYVARVLVGVWVGATTTVMPMYVAEISGRHIRSSLSTINNLLHNTGSLFTYILGTYVSYYTLAVSCEMITIVFILTFIFMPESPYYYIKRQERDKSIKSLSWLRKGETNQHIEDEVNRMQQSFESQNNQKGTLKDIFFHPGNRKAFIISFVYTVSRRLSGAGVLQAYASVTLPAVTLGLLDPDTCVIIIGFVSLFSSLFTTGISLKFKRRTLMTVSCLGCAAATSIIMIWFYLNQHTSVDVTEFSDAIFCSMILFYAAFNIGLGPIGASIKGEVFTPQVKGLSSPLLSLGVATFGFFLNKFYLIVAENVGMFANYLLYSVSTIAVIFFTWAYVPELHKKSLEEIHVMMSIRRKRTVKSEGSTNNVENTKN